MRKVSWYVIALLGALRVHLTLALIVIAPYRTAPRICFLRRSNRSQYQDLLLRGRRVGKERHGSGLSV